MTRKQYLTLAVILAIASIASLFLFTVWHFLLSFLIAEVSLFFLYLAFGKKHIS